MSVQYYGSALASKMSTCGSSTQALEASAPGCPCSIVTFAQLATRRPKKPTAHTFDLVSPGSTSRAEEGGIKVLDAYFSVLPSPKSCIRA